MTHVPNAADLTCNELVELVSDYIEGALTPVDRGRFEAHIEACDGCEAYLEQMRTTIAAVGTLRSTDLAPELRASLLGVFRDWKRARPSEPLLGVEELLRRDFAPDARRHSEDELARRDVLRDERPGGDEGLLTDLDPGQ